MCGKTAVAPVGNQMERPFSLESFGKKEGIPPTKFFGFTGIIGVSPYHLRFHTSTMLLDEIRGLSVKNCTVPLCGKFSPVFPTNESIPPFRFCLRKNCTVPSGIKCKWN